MSLLHHHSAASDMRLARHNDDDSTCHAADSIDFRRTGAMCGTDSLSRYSQPFADALDTGEQALG
jgi:hypothetical protein